MIMSYAQEMKNLAANIKISHKDRTADIKEIKKQTRDILAAADHYMKNIGKDLKDFLAKSQETRNRDFNATIKEIQAKIKEIKGDVKSFLAKSEEERMANFKVTMKDVTGKVEEIKKFVKGTLGDYKAERKEAAGYWASIKKRGVPAAEEEAEEAPVASKKKKNK